MEMLVVTLASLFAGFVDSMVGGGGLILVPALLTTFPGDTTMATADQVRAFAKGGSARIQR